MNKKQEKILYRIILTFLLIVLLKSIDLSPNINFACYMFAYLLIGYDILRKALKGILNRRIFDENFLMSIATLGAISLGDYTEAVAVMFFYQLGELFQSYAVGKTRKNINELMNIRPDYANIEKDNQLIKVSPSDVAIDSIIVVCPGEKIPLDGIIVEGKTFLNTSAITGESTPQSAEINTPVLSGSINLTGVIKIKTTSTFEESTVSKILYLVENASSKKAQSEKFISKFAKYYTPIVCYFALALAILPPLFQHFILASDFAFKVWLYRALTFLVISCPCALVISIPLSFFAGIGSASKYGILIKGANYLEALVQIKTIVFDKTGTMTKGVFEVCAIHHTPLEEEKLLEISAYAETYSNHPIAQSIKRAYNKPIDKSKITDLKEISGYGITATINNQSVIIGNEKLMQKSGIKYIPCHSIGTIIHIAIDNQYAGHLVISDIIKPTAKSAINQLKKLGIKKTIMLTGDTLATGTAVAKELNIDEVHTDLLPQDKVQLVEQFLIKNHKLAFVGDGINDAPVLTRADIGISMGGIGSDAAIEASDVVLMNDDPLSIALSIKISRQTLSIVYQNIYFAISIKIACLILGALGFANMWFAIFADVGVMVLAIINSIRTLFIKKMEI